MGSVTRYSKGTNGAAESKAMPTMIEHMMVIIGQKRLRIRGSSSKMVDSLTSFSVADQA